MKKIEITPEILWKKYIQARPDSIERAGYGTWHHIIGPEFQYEARCEENYCHLSVEYVGKFPDIMGVLSKIEDKITEERPQEFRKSNIKDSKDVKAFFDLIDRLNEEARDRFNKTKEDIPEYRELMEINKKWIDQILKPLFSYDKPLVRSIPCAELRFHPFIYLFPDEGYNKWITQLKFTEFLKKLRTPATSFPEIGDSISYSLYTKFSGNFDGVNAERSLGLEYKDGVFNLSSDEKQQESKSVNFKINALGNMVPVKK